MSPSLPCQAGLLPISQHTFTPAAEAPLPDCCGVPLLEASQLPLGPYSATQGIPTVLDSAQPRLEARLVCTPAPGWVNWPSHS